MALSRGVHPATIAALSSHFHPAILVEVGWPSGTVRLHSGLEPMTFDSKTWLPAGPFGRIDIPAEGAAEDDEASLTWIGRPADVASLLATNVRGVLVDIWLAVVTTPRGSTIVGEPFSVYSGYMDGNAVSVTGDGSGYDAMIRFDLRHGVPARAGTAVRHTAEDQAQKYPGDTAGRQVIHQEKAARNPPTWPEK